MYGIYYFFPNLIVILLIQFRLIFCDAILLQSLCSLEWILNNLVEMDTSQIGSKYIQRKK